jgi:uncharacterized membrane protein
MIGIYRILRDPKGDFKILTLSVFLWTALWTLLPISELRGGLPFAIAKGMPDLLAYAYCVFLNILITPIVFVFLQTLHKLLMHWKGYASLFDRLVERSRAKVKAKVDKYGYLGLALFVAVPLPVTGAYTGALGAWVLGMDRKKAFAAIALGVCISGVIVYTAVQLGIRLFFKEIG